MKSSSGDATSTTACTQRWSNPVAIIKSFQVWPDWNPFQASYACHRFLNYCNINTFEPVTKTKFERPKVRTWCIFLQRWFFSSHMRFRSGSIQPECQNDASNIWRRYHRYVELGQVNLQEIVNFEQSQQNVEGRFPIQATCFFWVGPNHSPGLDREHWNRKANTLWGNTIFLCR